MATNNPIKPPPGFTLINDNEVKPPPGFTLITPEEAGQQAGLSPTSGAVGRFFQGAAAETGLPIQNQPMNPMVEANLRSAMGAARIFAGAPGTDIAENSVRNVLGQASSGNIAGATGAATAAAASYGLPQLLAKIGAPELLNRMAESQYGKALYTTKELPKAIAEKRVVPGALERGVWEPTFSGLAKRAETESADALTRLNSAWSALPQDTKVKAQPIYDKMEELIKSAHVKGTNIVENPGLKRQAELVQEKLMAMMDSAGEISIESVNDWRKQMDKFVFDRKGFYMDTPKIQAETEAKRAATNAVRREIAKDHPDIGALNKEFNFWQNFEDILAQTKTRQQGQQRTVELMKTTAGGLLGGMLGTSAGHPWAGAAMGAALENLFKSPGWRTASAVAKKNLADALVSGNAAKIGLTMFTIGSGISFPTSRYQQSEGQNGQP